MKHGDILVETLRLEQAAKEMVEEMNKASDALEKAGVALRLTLWRLQNDKADNP